MATRDQVKQWFETNDYPTQEQFWAWLDSILFSGEVAVADVAGLIELLQSKLNSADFEFFQKGELINANANHVYQQAANTLIETIVIIPGADALIKIGTTNGDEDILGEVEVIQNDPKSYPQVVYAFTDVQRNLYINGIPNGSKIIILKRPLKTV